MILFAAVILCGSILNASLISASEREREIATLRTMGYSRFEVGNVFLRESLLVTISGTVLGLPLGRMMCEVFAVLYETELPRPETMYDHAPIDPGITPFTPPEASMAPFRESHEPSECFSE